MLSIDRKIEIPHGKYVYFASDFHFGIPDQETSRAREKEVCHWMDRIKADAHCLFLMGDIWDAWMEYKLVMVGKCIELVLRIQFIVYKTSVPIIFKLFRNGEFLLL